ncbi:MAG: hypothetical protein FD145_674 [Candidatus Saganbacteria bacterium]|uniref:Uncharacterized protein n=1 Tax=Candidatus Saganbacteria bacterium TaxID=2575572 RepID=A0A833L1K6_UNCSA|nr:MAG: hypothetical protein FD145_674 [Candidatus Saganbacteria bacterium]
MAKARSKSNSNNFATIFLLALVFSLTTAACALANSSLLFKEAQLVIGQGQSQHMPMQESSLGIDYLNRLSGDSGDRALLAFQGRFVWNNGKNRIEPQIYNSYIKFKNPFTNLWLGHSQASYGLNSYFDSHALLLAPLGMTDFGFENDWGAGLLRDTNWGDIAISYTLGSGMSVQAEGNHLASTRISFGVINQRNFNIGLSKANGTLAQNIAVDFTGLDGALLYENYELRVENTSGAKSGLSYHSFLVRGGIKFLEEDRLKLELQQVNSEQGTMSDQATFFGLTYIFDENLTFRLMGQSEAMAKDIKLTFQGYFYTPW